MKKSKYLAYACMLTSILISSCQKEQIHQKEKPGEITSTVLNQIKSLGFSTKNIQKTAEGYLVENDILLTPQNLEQAGTITSLLIAKTEQYQTTNLVTSLPRTITVTVSGLNNYFVQAAQETVNNYNALGLRLRFQYVSGSADIIIRGECLGAGQLGYSGFPTGGNPYPTVVMNSCSPYFGSNVGFIRSVLEHEIGHCIGFRHTDWFDRSYSCGSGGNEGDAGVGAIHIPGTPSGTDAGSWMLACNSGTAQSFNENDKTALRYLYGAPQPALQLTSAPVVIARGDDTYGVGIYAKGPNNNLFHRYFNSQTGWSVWENLGGQLAEAPVAIHRSTDGYGVGIYVRGVNNNLLHKYFQSGVGWSAWEDLGGQLTTPPAVIKRGTDPSGVGIYARGTNNNLIHKYFTPGVGWSAWEDLGGQLTSAPAVVSRGNDVYGVGIYARGVNNNLIHKYFESGSGWSAWEDLGGQLTSAPVVTRRGFDAYAVNIYAKGTNNHLIHKFLQAGVGWSAWEDLSGQLISPPVAVIRGNPDGIGIYARGFNNELIHKYFAPGAGWSAWDILGGQLTSDPAVVRRGNDPVGVGVYAKDIDNHLIHKYYDPATGWSGWSTL
ncbi:M57 family metalloprotease [Chitinophaga nivalis]|uniref:M57 family metalloprotease n=1 Tax=Chitinophaga nivalis TaxID=2991709 RepID=A0ABT3IUQ4_9BACT|nr:M57 family metalloprotease [Chitinophaga nivalis]MCW3462582.1 M57 family metalloprotease [Chitinophaga nivalis]MCW3487727.1 M57 family metalloprotease [Chitinophaga nivalis]